MRLLKSLTFSGLSVAARTAAALVTFSIVARVLGPAQYGQLMLCMSVATLLMLLSNLGLVQFLLREIGRAPHEAHALLSQTLSAKLMLTTVAALVGLAAMPLLPRGLWLTYLLLVAAMFAEGLVEFLCAGFRARSRFDMEARLALVSSWLYPFTVGVVAYLSQSLVLIAAAYLMSRLAVAWITWSRLSGLLGGLRAGSAIAGWHHIRHSASYAADAALTAPFGQVDSLVLNAYLGPQAVGIYQAGMRLFAAGQRATMVLRNVFLPRLAAAQHAAGEGLQRETRRVNSVFMAVGFGFGLLLAGAATPIVAVMYGQAFEPLVALLPWFGLLFFVRFLSVGWGIQLTALGLQKLRSVYSAAHWVVVALAAVWLVPKFGMVGWLLALLAGNTSLLAMYSSRLCRSRHDAFRLALAAVLSLAFVPLLPAPTAP